MRSDTLPEGRGAFAGYIGPKNLLTLVENTAPWLFGEGPPPFAHVPELSPGRLIELAHHPLGYWHVLRAADRLEAMEEPGEAELGDYFTLCLAAHFASVATFVPTDVDTKIRDRLWAAPRSEAETDRLAELALGLGAWDIRPVSRRWVSVGELGTVSGHDGERLSVLCGGLVTFEKIGRDDLVARTAEAIEAELDREARAFDRVARAEGRELELLVLAASLTHNAGDVDQGLSARGRKREARPWQERFGRLAHERPRRFGRAFSRAARIYRRLLAAEGHRHYPLRKIPVLREHPDLLLGLGPCLDAWGERLARFAGWDDAQRAEIVTGIAVGLKKVKGQKGYQRALKGFDDTFPGGLHGPRLGPLLGNAARKLLQDKEVRKDLMVARSSFESSLAKATRRLLPSNLA